MSIDGAGIAREGIRCKSRLTTKFVTNPKVYTYISGKPISWKRCWISKKRRKKFLVQIWDIYNLFIYLQSTNTIKIMEFTESDLEGSGQYLVRTDKEDVVSTSFLSTIMYKVGYYHSMDGTGKQKYCLISMSDGWTQLGEFDKHGSKNPDDWSFNEFLTKQQLVDSINRRTFRKATQEEIVRVVLSQTSRTQN